MYWETRKGSGKGFKVTDQVPQKLYSIYEQTFSQGSFFLDCILIQPCLFPDQTVDMEAFNSG